MKIISFDAIQTDKDTGEKTPSFDFALWRRGVADLTPEEIDHGVKKALDFKGYFHLPAFRDLCRGSSEEFGLPNSKTAYLEACLAKYPKDQQTYSHPIVYMAGQAAGWFNLKHQGEGQIFKLFDHEYKLLVNRVRSGEQFKIQPALTHNPYKQYDALTGQGPVKHKKNRARFKELQKMLNHNPPQEEGVTDEQ